jgi:hypothetical protein
MLHTSSATGREQDEEEDEEKEGGRGGFKEGGLLSTGTEEEVSSLSAELFLLSLRLSFSWLVVAADRARDRRFCSSRTVLDDSLLTRGGGGSLCVSLSLSLLSPPSSSCCWCCTFASMWAVSFSFSASFSLNIVKK